MYLAFGASLCCWESYWHMKKAVGKFPAASSNVLCKIDFVLFQFIINFY